MPRKTRHNLRAVGAVASGAQSAPQDGAGFSRGILYLEGLDTCVATLEFSPDGGSTWYEAYGLDGTQYEWTLATGDLVQAHSIDALAGLFRVSVLTANLTDCYLEGLREIA